MPDNADSGGLVSHNDLKELAELFDAAEYALQPDSQEARGGTGGLRQRGAAPFRGTGGKPSRLSERSTALVQGEVAHALPRLAQKELRLRITPQPTRRSFFRGTRDKPLSLRAWTGSS